MSKIWWLFFYKKILFREKKWEGRKIGLRKNPSQTRDIFLSFSFSFLSIFSFLFPDSSSFFLPSTSVRAPSDQPSVALSSDDPPLTPMRLTPTPDDEWRDGPLLPYECPARMPTCPAHPARSSLEPEQPALHLVCQPRTRPASTLGDPELARPRPARGDLGGHPARTERGPSHHARRLAVLAQACHESAQASSGQPSNASIQPSSTTNVWPSRTLAAFDHFNCRPWVPTVSRWYEQLIQTYGGQFRRP